MRIEELLELQPFVRTILAKYWKKEEKSTIMFAGDYNVNCRLDFWEIDVLSRLPEKQREFIIWTNKEKGHWSDYETLISILRLSTSNHIFDILDLTSPIPNPVTYCEANHNEYGELENWDKVLICENERQNQCLDYFLLLEYKEEDSPPFCINRDFSMECQVNKFEVEGEIFKMLSDHYALEMKMRIF